MTFFEKLIAKWNGRVDGKKNRPGPQDDLSIYEKTLVDGYEATVQILTREWHQKDSKLEEDYCGMLQTAKNVLEEIKKIEPSYEALKDKAENIIVPDGTYKNRGYLVLMAFLAASEFPLNSVIFNLLGEARWLTYLIAIGIAVAIPFAAHYMGILLRRESPLHSWRGGLKCGAFFLIVFFVLSLIAWFREKYIVGMGVTKLLGIQLDPMMVNVLFLSMNLLIFTVATIASYFTHLDVTDRMIKEHREMIMKRKRIKKTKDELEDETEEISKKLKKLKKRLEELEESIAKIHARREKLFQIYKERVEMAVKSCHYLVNLYRLSNTRARKDGITPECFKQEPAISIAPFDGEFDQTC